MKIYSAFILLFISALAISAQDQAGSNFIKRRTPLPRRAQDAARKPVLPGNLARYENEYPSELFKNAAVKMRLRRLLGKSYPSFLEAIDVQEPMTKEGDLLIGKGCAKGLCTIYEAMIVIDLAAKTIHCGIVSTAAKTMKYRIFSETPNNSPAILKDWADALLKGK